MLHQSHLQQPPHESQQPERTCSNSWATRRMISSPAEWNKDKVTWNSAPGARNMASQQRAFRPDAEVSQKSLVKISAKDKCGGSQQQATFPQGCQLFLTPGWHDLCQQHQQLIPKRKPPS
nr:uncharacterized protein LOC102064295 [Zonotrichia albicollis]